MTLPCSSIYDRLAKAEPGLIYYCLIALLTPAGLCRAGVISESFRNSIHVEQTQALRAGGLEMRSCGSGSQGRRAGEPESVYLVEVNT